MWSENVALDALRIAEEPFASAMLGAAYGYAVYRRRAFAVSPASPHAAHTRFHEIAHLVLGDMYGADRPPRETREHEADAVAALCCRLTREPVLETQPMTDGAARVWRAALAILRAGWTVN